MEGAAQVNLSLELAPNKQRGLPLANPVMTASGTFGYGTEYAEFFDIQRLGAIICKGTTLLPRAGNPQPRIAETAGGVLNSIGLQNAGVEALIAAKAPVWAGWQVPVIVNIAGETVDEYAQLAKRLDAVPGVSGLEVNISCPNVAAGGAEFGAQPEPAARVTEAVRQATSLPIIVKLTPNTAEIVAVAEAVAKAGADAVSLINTLKGMAIDIAGRRPLLGNRHGGLSGPAIKPVALRMVNEVAAAVDIPVIGCGGIMTGEDAIEFFIAGADAVQVGTASLTTPTAAIDVLEGIERFMAEHGLASIAELRGG
jgi:dihydroorotate dehydrogenase (NAD+) catalytic subunit